MTGKDLRRKAACLLVAFLCTVGSGTIPAAFASAQRTNSALTGFAQDMRRDRITRIISLLEDRTRDRRVLDKAAEKLLTLDEGRLRLLSSLSERISAHHDTPGADIAFSLLTAMLVLS